MPSQTPPGRAGRPWLLERIATATHGMELLREKQQLLAREQRRLLRHREQTELEWAHSCAQAELWSTRAAVVSGSTSTQLAGAKNEGRTNVTITWRNTMGVVHPDEARVNAPKLSSLERAALNSAIGPSSAPHRRARGAGGNPAGGGGARGRIEAGRG